ncbi:meiotically up-regulated protein [Purpureocillium lavendulum]|uniref:Pre-rRNA-processing protein IPI1 n=1 Tax=Purpureocillium lavendulum TaxID=1247861 RepID=A0AB34FXY9_9HYPO|nr:meiotically up-regulated protein [Purpureocillium lavendulum]
MGSSARKKAEKKKDFKKPKYKVGKDKPKASNFTDTSFKAKSIVMGHQSLSTEAPDVIQQFKHNLSLASSSRSDKQRRESLAYLTSQLSSEPPTNPVGTHAILTKLLPLISDSSTPVRAQLLKLLRTLPEEEVSHSIDRAVMYIRAGMTHLSTDISNDALGVMEWLLDVADDELVTCPGGWVKTLNTFCAMMGWAVSTSSGGWTSGARGTLKAKDAQTLARQIAALAKFLEAGFKNDDVGQTDSAEYWDNLYRIPRAPNAFDFLNLSGARRDEEGEMYSSREARQQVFSRKFLEPMMKGLDKAKKEGGATGRAASTLEQTLLDGMKDFEPSTALDTQDLLDLCDIPGWVGQEGASYTAPVREAGEHQWDGNARIYQWDNDFGDVGPKFPELELELFGDPALRHERVGLDFSKINEIEVQQEGPVKIDPIRTFKDAGLHPLMIENVVLAGYDNPTPIQKFTIPAMLQGYDVIGVAQTGSGKTAAYLIPILSKLMGKAKKFAAPRPNPSTFMEGRDEVVAEPLVLIVVPTRELAVQIFNEARKFCYRTMLRPGVVYGGAPIRQQVALLSRGCDVLVGTPGRLVDFIGRPNILTLRRLRHLVVDEADEMLDCDWDEEIRQIFTGGEQDEGNIKYALFSATFPKAARELAKDHLSSSHVRFRVGRAGSTTENIKQTVIQTEREDKRQVLFRLLGEMHGVRTIIFTNSRQEVDNLDDYLFNMQLPVTSIHRDRTQEEREAAMRAFRSGNAPILIATGVMARGIDVRNVMHVINYDLPSMEYGGIEEYTHRIGRTGRIGHRGLATSFFTERDEPMASVLTRTLLETKQEIPDFLQMYVPEGPEAEKPKFETESDFDPEDVGGPAEDGGDAWGGGEAANASNGWGEPQDDGAKNSAGGGWGAPAPEADSGAGGWGAPAPAPASGPAGW